MFDLFDRSGTLKLWQIHYCDGAYQSCARHERALSGRPVPASLLPNGRELRPSAAALRDAGDP